MLYVKQELLPHLCSSCFVLPSFSLPLPLCPAYPDARFPSAAIFLDVASSFCIGLHPFLSVVSGGGWLGICISCAACQCCRYTDKGRAYNPYAPTLGDSLNTAFISAVYANIQSTQISTAIAFRLTCWSRSQVRYVLGDAGRSLVSGWGKKPPTHVQVTQCSLWYSVLRAMQSWLRGACQDALVDHLTASEPFVPVKLCTLTRVSKN